MRITPLDVARDLVTGIARRPRRRPLRPFLRVAIDGEPTMRKSYPWPYTKTGKINSNYVHKVNIEKHWERVGRLREARASNFLTQLLSVIVEIEAAENRSQASCLDGNSHAWEASYREPKNHPLNMNVIETNEIPTIARLSYIQHEVCRRCQAKRSHEA